MATNYFGKDASGSVITVHTGPGRFIGWIISHNLAAVQRVVVYDNTAASGTEILNVWVAPEQCPALMMYPEEYATPFAVGLTVDAGSCEVVIWAVGD